MHTFKFALNTSIGENISIIYIKIHFKQYENHIWEPTQLDHKILCVLALYMA